MSYETGLRPPEASPGERDLKKEYDKLTQFREPFLRRARDCALVTLPYLMPPEGHSGQSDFPTPNQSIGAQGVNNLANLLLDSLFPPQAPFFRLTMDDQTLAELTQDPEARADIEERLASLERQVKVYVDGTLPRAVTLFALKQLVVSGNVLLVLREDNSARAHRLDSFVVQRDGGGRLMKAIVREEVSPQALPKEVREALPKDHPTGGEQVKSQGDVPVYTCYERKDKRIISFQQVKGIEVPGSRGNWPEDKAPVLALRWSWQDGEDYGRSYAEEFLGDLEAAEGLSRSIREATAASAKVVIMVAPNGVTREVDIVNAENLDVITGRPDDVGMLQLEKQADLAVANQVLQGIIQRLSQAFVLHLGVRRDAERVTAEETRMVIMALEQSLGGTYALLAMEFQLPLVRIVISKLERKGKFPKLPMGTGDGPEVTPQITTGVEALGRGEDFNRYSQFISSLMQAVGPEVILEYINVRDFITRMGASLSIDMQGLVKSEAQLQQEREQAMLMQQQQLAQQTMAKGAEKVIPEVAKAAMGS